MKRFGLKWLLMMRLVSYFIKMLDKAFIDDVLDKAEELAAKTDNTLDDNIVKSLVDQIRLEFDIPDDIDGDED